MPRLLIFIALLGLVVAGVSMARQARQGAGDAGPPLVERDSPVDVRDTPMDEDSLIAAHVAYEQRMDAGERPVGPRPDPCVSWCESGRSLDPPRYCKQEFRKSSVIYSWCLDDLTWDELEGEIARCEGVGTNHCAEVVKRQPYYCQAPGFGHDDETISECFARVIEEAARCEGVNTVRCDSVRETFLAFERDQDDPKPGDRVELPAKVVTLADYTRSATGVIGPLTEDMVRYRDWAPMDGYSERYYTDIEDVIGLCFAGFMLTKDDVRDCGGVER